MSAIKSHQLRAARALLGWSQEKLAEMSGVSLPTIKRLEPGEDVPATKVETMERLRQAFEAAGVEFTNGGQPGIRMMMLQTWWEIHLTPKGWVKGNKLLDYGRETTDAPPRDRVLTIRQEVRGAGHYPKPLVRWHGEDVAAIRRLLSKYDKVLDDTPAPNFEDLNLSK